MEYFNANKISSSVFTGAHNVPESFQIFFWHFRSWACPAIPSSGAVALATPGVYLSPRSEPASSVWCCLGFLSLLATGPCRYRRIESVVRRQCAKWKSAFSANFLLFFVFPLPIFPAGYKQLSLSELYLHMCVDNVRVKYSCKELSEWRKKKKGKMRVHIANERWI